MSERTTEYARVHGARVRLDVALSQVVSARAEIAAVVGVDHQTSRGLASIEMDTRVAINRIEIILRRMP